MSAKPFALLAVLALLAACGPESDPPDDNTPTLQEIATADDGTLEVTLLAPRELRVGRNVVTYRVEELSTGAPVTDAVVTHLPVMHMAAHSHTCPFVEPVATEATGGEYVGEIVFNMAGGEMGRWDNTVTVLTGGEAREVVFANLTVAETDARRDLVVEVGEESHRYILTLDFDAEPKVGMNAFVLTAHRRMGMMSFPAQTDLSITMIPEMPTMGHGSSGNVDPTHEVNGNYAGSVNLTMPGYWTLDFEVRRGEELLGTVRWDLTL